MKKLLVLATVGLVVAFVGSALAQPPPGAVESAVWYYDEENGVWVEQDITNPEAYNGRLYRAGIEELGNCNKKYWYVDVKIYAHIAQWIDFRLNWNEWHWFIRKPGCYAGNCIEAKIASNGDIYVDFDMFGPLLPMDPANADHNPIDEIYYGFGETFSAANATWVLAAALNDQDFRILDEDPWDLHYGIAWKLWTKICVDECNSACDYMNEAKITLSLEQQKDWINWDTGEWFGF
jgi:hypothetical protein